VVWRRAVLSEGLTIHAELTDEVKEMARTGTLRLTMAALASLVLVAGAFATNANTAGGNADRRHASHEVIKVTLHGVDGSKVGWVSLHQDRGHVEVRGIARGLTPGFHGFHVHAIGLCEADAPSGPFTTAGGHYTGGLPNHGDHAGDMPSLLVTADGHAFSSFVTDRFSLADLRDTDGSAVMVHAGRDNFANIPSRYTSGGVAGPDAVTLATGDAGARAACGVIPPAGR
jgi:Cu-Zn family superoxide dismutase